MTTANDSKRLTSTACGILVQRFGLDADEAHRLVRYSARNNRITLAETANRILGRRAAFELLSALRRLADKRTSD
ncbi:MAG: ANTAR domain-containing protein [Gammaproteobacteria bacterium]|nr:ANTAR domain-containing protein [Gammaproteobacteria bacterium]